MLWNIENIGFNTRKEYQAIRNNRLCCRKHTIYFWCIWHVFLLAVLQKKLKIHWFVLSCLWSNSSFLMSSWEAILGYDQIRQASTVSWTDARVLRSRAFNLDPKRACWLQKWCQERTYVAGVGSTEWTGNQAQGWHLVLGQSVTLVSMVIIIIVIIIGI